MKMNSIKSKFHGPLKYILIAVACVLGALLSRNPEHRMYYSSGTTVALCYVLSLVYAVAVYSIRKFQIRRIPEKFFTPAFLLFSFLSGWIVLSNPAVTNVNPWRMYLVALLTSFYLIAMHSLYCPASKHVAGFGAFIALITVMVFDLIGFPGLVGPFLVHPWIGAAFAALTHFAVTGISKRFNITLQTKFKQEDV